MKQQRKLRRRLNFVDSHKIEVELKVLQIRLIKK